jgi:hypothetical protein
MTIKSFLFKLTCGLFKHWLTWFYFGLGLYIYYQPIEQFSVIGKESGLIIITIFLGLSTVMTKLEDIQEDMKSLLPKRGE